MRWIFGIVGLLLGGLSGGVVGAFFGALIGLGLASLIFCTWTSGPARSGPIRPTARAQPARCRAMRPRRQPCRRRPRRCRSVWRGLSMRFRSCVGNWLKSGVERLQRLPIWRLLPLNRRRPRQRRCQRWRHLPRLCRRRRWRLRSRRLNLFLSPCPSWHRTSPIGSSAPWALPATGCWAATAWCGSAFWSCFSAWRSCSSTRRTIACCRLSSGWRVWRSGRSCCSASVGACAKSVRAMRSCCRVAVSACCI